MKTLRFTFAALATIFALEFASTASAFMPTDESVPAEGVETDLQKMVKAFQEEIDAGETSCEDMLAKLDKAIDDIDLKLDAGAENEEELLVVRDQISKMRYNLNCFAQTLTQSVSGGLGNLGAAGGGGAGGGVLGGPVSNVGSLSGQIGGTAVGGSALSGLVPLGVIAGVAIPAATSSSSNPGTPASPSN